MAQTSIFSNKISRYFVKWNNSRRENNRFLLANKIWLEANIIFSQVTYGIWNIKPGNIYEK